MFVREMRLKGHEGYNLKETGSLAEFANAIGTRTFVRTERFVQILELRFLNNWRSDLLIFLKEKFVWSLNLLEPRFFYCGAPPAIFGGTISFCNWKKEDEV